MKIAEAILGVLTIAGFSRVARANDDTSSVPDNSPRFLARFSAKAEGGLDYRVLYGSHVIGGDVSAAAGVELRPGAIYLAADVMLGETAYGLFTSDWRLTPSWEFRYQRVRVALGPSLSYMQITRITSPDHPFHTAGLGLFGQASFDLVQRVRARGGRPTPPSAIYAALRFNLDVLQSDDDGAPLFYGPSIAVGFRY